jgi:dienelactone hydrolase
MLIIISVLAGAQSANAISSSDMGRMVLSEVPDMKKPFVMDPANPGEPALIGYYNYSMKLKDGMVRTVKEYIPSHAFPKRASIIIAAPNGADSMTFLLKSGWKAIADKHLVTLILMEPLNGVWGSNETEYMAGVLSFVKSNTYYRHGGMGAYYLVGYGEGADVLAAEALANTNQYAGASFLGGKGVPVSMLEKMKNTMSAEPGIMQSQIPLPVWIASEQMTPQIDALVSYWKKANKLTDDDVYQNKFADAVYHPLPYMALTNQITEANVAKVYVSLGKRDFYNTDFVNYLYNDFLSRVQCYPAYGNNRALRSWAEPAELGYEYVNLVVNGVTREMYVYTPTSVRSGKLKNVPVVLVFHGANVNGNESAVRYGWYKIAEEKGFIVVCPSGYRTNGYITNFTWTLQNDLPFAESIISYMLKNYPIDSTRIYASGSSNGSQMALLLQAKIPNLIAATASYDMVMDISPFQPNEKYKTAIMIIVGDRDPINNQGGKPIMKTDQFISMSKYLVARYGLNQTKKYSNGNYDFYLYETNDGVPLFEFELCNGRIHADLPEDTYVCFDYMSKFTRNADGGLYYMGVPVK